MSETDVDERTYDADEYDPNPREAGKWLSAVIAVLGLWMIVQALWFDVAASQFWNDIIVGALLLAAGGYNYSRRANEQLASVGAAALAALLGLWLIVAPFVVGGEPGFTEAQTDPIFWNDIVIGVIALVLGAYSAYGARDRADVARPAER